jgi:hypothetical protein
MDRISLSTLLVVPPRINIQQLRLIQLTPLPSRAKILNKVRAEHGIDSLLGVYSAYMPKNPTFLLLVAGTRSTIPL